jgi:hypothetical protein
VQPQRRPVLEVLALQAVGCKMDAQATVEQALHQSKIGLGARIPEGSVSANFPDAIVVWRVNRLPTTEEVFSAFPDFAPLDTEKLVMIQRWWAFHNHVRGPVSFQDAPSLRNGEGELLYLACGYYCDRCKTTFFADLDDRSLFQHECMDNPKGN